jgi:hypothetical protein
MIKLIVGLRGSGKTKTLVDMVNAASAESKGSVICIEYGNKLNFDIKPQARLIDSTAYAVTDAKALYGFIAGILASNYDITHVYVDSVLKICDYDMVAFEKFVLMLDALAADRCEVVMTVSAATEDIPHALVKFI